MENVWILLAIFVVLMMMHVPIAVAMGLSSLIGFMMIGYNLTTVGSLLYTAVASTSMITIPGYIFAGAIMAKGGDSETSANALNAWIGHVPGAWPLRPFLPVPYLQRSQALLPQPSQRSAG